MDESGPEECFRLVRVLRRRDSRGLFNHARPDKSDLRSRLGNHDVPERGKTGGDAAKRGIGKDGDKRKALAIMHGRRRRNLGHLHQ